jgi:uncharacterized protein (TIGR02996 family)
MMTETNFLHAIREAPHDDDLRLVFADWLDEQDDPRGELVRLEMTVSRLPEDDPGRDALERQARRLVEEHAESWLGPLQGRLFRWSCPRGLFAIEARAPVLFPLPDAPDVYPWIEQVQLWRVEEVSGDRLLELGRFPHLTSLDLNHNHLGPERVDSLLQIPNLPYLAELCLWENALTDEGAMRLLEAGKFERLISLDLSSNQLGWQTATVLAQEPAFQRLQTLDLRGNDIGDMGAAWLVAGLYLQQLRKLYLGHCHLTDRAVESLADSTTLQQLRLLALGGNQIGWPGVEALGVADPPELEELWLTSNPLGRAGAVRLARTSLWSRLRRLSLFDCHIGDDGARALADAGSTRLAWLDLGENGFGPAAADALARSPSLWAQLTELNLADNVLGDEGACALAESPQLAGLRVLNLDGNDINDAGATALARSPHLEQIRSLKLGRNQLRRAGETALRRRFGDRVEW